MTTPLPWSHTSLDDFVNCPRSFYRKRVIRDVKDEGGEHLVWGNKVHKAFEDYVKDHIPLPDMLEQHKNFLDMLRRRGDVRHTERKIALNLKGQPCGFFDKDVWFRGVIDFHSIQGSVAEVVDYKTGKAHSKFQQLHLFALWLFAANPEIMSIRLTYYWTATSSTTSELVHRHQLRDLWGAFLPNLRQYAQAFRDDIWQPRQSGLCNGWCPVTDCEFWKPKRRH